MTKTAMSIQSLLNADMVGEADLPCSVKPKAVESKRGHATPRHARGAREGVESEVNLKLRVGLHSR